MYFSTLYNLTYYYGQGVGVLFRPVIFSALLTD